MPLVTSGVEHGNLRELALNRMKDLGTECRDVRTREVGIVDIHNKIKPDQVCFFNYFNFKIYILNINYNIIKIVVLNVIFIILLLFLKTC